MTAETRGRRGNTVLRARWVVPVAGEPIDGGWVSVARGRIVAMGAGQPPGAARDLGEAIILPGLVNAHTHLEFSALEAPLPTAGGLPAWIERVVAERRGRSATDGAETGGGEPRAGGSATTVRAAAISRGLAESARGGVTTVGEIATADHPAHCGPGPRVRVFREVLGLSGPAMRSAAAALGRDLERLGRRGTPCGVAPHAPYSVGRPLGVLALRQAARRHLPVMMHIAESREEGDLLATGTGSFRGLLERLGAWRADAPPRLVPASDWITLMARAWRGAVVHGTFLPEDAAALDRLARHRDRLCVVVCPRTALALSGRWPPVRAFREAGVRVALGTDSRASTPDLSVLSECRALVTAGLAAPQEAVAMATREGAWALGLERRCGILAPGRPADLAILRPTAGSACPWEAAVAADTRVTATLRGGRLLCGTLSD